MCMLCHFSHVQLVALQAPLSMGILQARILEWVAVPSSRRSSWPRDWTHISCDSFIGGRVFIAEPLGKPYIHIYTSIYIYTHIYMYLKVKVKVAQSCLTLCDPMDYTVHGILQARILEWVACPFSRASSQHRDRTQVFHIAGRFFTSWATRGAPIYIYISKYIDIYISIHMYTHTHTYIYIHTSIYLYLVYI